MFSLDMDGEGGGGGLHCSQTMAALPPPPPPPNLITCSNLVLHQDVILHIAYSRYRAIPAIDIDIRDILLERSLPVRPHPALRGMHACNAIALSISQRTASTA